MTRLKSIVACVLLTISCHLLALAASQEECYPALDAQLEREKRWDEWKNLGKVGALVSQRVIDWLIPRPLGIFLGEALSSSANKILEVESEAYRAIENLTCIVELQRETSMRLFNEMELLVKELIIDDNYNKHVELYLTALHGAYMEYADSIGKSKVLQKIKMDELGEECELYKPKQSLRKLLNTMEHCFLSDDSCPLYGQTLEGNDVMPSRNSINNILSQKLVCKLERAYRVQENQSASLSNTVDAIMANVNELIVFSRICSAVVHKDNALKREDAFNTAAAVGVEINSKMVEWAENRLESAWPDEMRSKAKEIIEGFTQEYKIPQGDLQKLSDRIRTAMQSMSSRKYAHQVMLISQNYAKPIFNGTYSYSENLKYNFVVKDVKKVSVIVSRHIYSLADCLSTYLNDNELVSLKEILDNNGNINKPDFHSMDYEERYGTIVFVVVQILGEPKDCASHKAFFARSLELYQGKCPNSAWLMESSPRVERSISIPRSPCIWLFGFM